MFLRRSPGKQIYITGILLVLVYTGSILCAGFKKSNETTGYRDLPDSLFAGSAACVSCHKTIFDDNGHTAHNITSRPGSAEFIKGNVDSGNNFFNYNKFIKVAMEKKEGNIFQTVYINGEPNQSKPIDIVIGSGTKGQTYLYWNDDLLYQLPVSYYSVTGQWCNSPGYPSGMPRFNRVIPGRCLECHSSRAKVEDVGNNISQISKNSIVYGVDCERCHGAAAQHVSFHIANPDEKNGRHILTQESLTRQQQLDLCALCHSGIRKPIKPVFEFNTGDRLDDFSLPDYHSDSIENLDVHGNQYGLLSSSKCFRNSQKMTCSSCHSPHKKEVDQPALFSQRCINCHNSASTKIDCTVKHPNGIKLADNCIDCHMPALPSKAIFLQLEDKSKSTADFVRTHRIAIYKGESKKFLKK